MEKIILPLLKDHHSHISAYAALGASPSIYETKDKAAALAILGKVNGEIGVVTGWDNSRYNFTESELAALPPVIICNISFHSFLASPAVNSVLSEKHREIVRNFNDQYWTEKNLSQIFAMFGELRPFSPEAAQYLMNSLAAQGVWYLEDMQISDTAALEYLSAKFPERTRFWAAPGVYQAMNPGHKKLISGLKVFTDGAVGAYTAALSEPYKNGKTGMLLFQRQELTDFFCEAAKNKLAASAHAIGDLAIELVLQAAEIALEKCPDLKIRIEHAQYITLSQAKKAKQLGLTLSMQPNFSIDSVVYADRLPAVFIAGNNPFRMLIDSAGFIPGKDLIFGSDGMPHGAEFALQMSLFPPNEGQKLTLNEFKAGYCIPDLTHGSITLEIKENKINASCKLVS